MTVFVSPIRKCEPNKRWPWKHHAYLFGDDEAELHALAESIGVRRKWLHRRRWFDHYDIHRNVRQKPRKSGAVAVPMAFVVATKEGRIRSAERQRSNQEAHLRRAAKRQARREFLTKKYSDEELPF